MLLVYGMQLSPVRMVYLELFPVGFDLAESPEHLMRPQTLVSQRSVISPAWMDPGMANAQKKAK